MRIKEKLSNNWPFLILALLGLFVSAINLPWNSWLLGWDNLVPELDLKLNILRYFSSSWSEYQGLGHADAAASAAEITRSILTLPFSLFLPAYTLRSAWIAFMLVLGPYGTYLLAKETVGEKANNRLVADMGPLIAGIVYLFNFATVQIFYTPFEPFSSFYGFLPLLLFSALKLLRSGKRKDVLVFFLISLLSSPAFFVQTFFIVYVLILALFIMGFLLTRGRNGWRRVMLVMIVLLTANLYWLAPVIYFTLTQSQVVSTAKANILATPDTQFINKAFGGLKNTIQFKSFNLEFTDVVNDLGHGYLFAPWRGHISSGLYTFVSVALFGLSLLGILASFFVKRGRLWARTLPLLLLVSLIMLSGGDGFLGLPFVLLTKPFPILLQVFRSPFTKWSTPLILLLSLGVARLVSLVLSGMRGKISLLASFIFLIMISSLSVISVKPLFEAKMIYDNLKVELPSEYNMAFDFMRTKNPQGRIAYFPTYTFWGWDFYDWGYRGSGFLWYGFRQPLLSRAFDVWSVQNGAFFNEISTAVYREDVSLFANVLSKYDVSYALVDESVKIPLIEDKKLLRLTLTKEMLEDMGAKSIFSEGFISIYEIPYGHSSFAYAPSSYAKRSIDLQNSRIDPAFADGITYVSSDDADTSRYLFGSLSKEKLEDIKIEDVGDGVAAIVVNHNLPDPSTLFIPKMPKGSVVELFGSAQFVRGAIRVEIEPSITVSVDGEVRDNLIVPTLLNIPVPEEVSDIIVGMGGKFFGLFEGQTVGLSGVKAVVGEPLAIDVFNKGDASKFDLEENFLLEKHSVCWERESGKGLVRSIVDGRERVFVVQDAAACVSFRLPTPKVDTLLQLDLPFRSPNGARPHFCVSEVGDYKCLNDDIFYRSQTSRQVARVSRSLILKAGKEYRVLFVARPPDIAGEKWEIRYKEPTFRYSRLVSRGELGKNIWDKLDNDTLLYLPQGKAITVKILSKKNKLDFRSYGRKSPFNCDPLKRGEVGRKVSKNQLEFTAFNWGIVCDFYALDAASTREEFLIRFVGENRLGRSAKAVVFNQSSNRTDLEILLSSGKFDDIYTLLSWPGTKESSYSLSLETRSFGEKSSKNIFSEIATFRLPLSWLSGWRLVPDGGEKIVANTLAVNDVNKIGASFYEVETNVSGGGGLLALSQGYDKGWIAFDSSFNKFEHVKVNSWSNGWIIPEGNHTVYIFYWPQALQWIGFALLLLVPGWYILYNLRKRSR